MSLYFKPGKGWRYDFTLKGKRHTKAWFKTKAEARRAEAQQREEVLNPEAEPESAEEETPTVMGFLELLNRRLDHLKAYNSESHFNTSIYLARRWAKRWGHCTCESITPAMIQKHLLERKAISAYTANKDLRYLRATFGFGVKKKLIEANPTDGLDFFPVEKKVKYIPGNDDIEKVLAVADPETRDYLVVIRETMARVSEINRLRWDDINLDGKYIILYTRKKVGGHLTPRKVPMTGKLQETLQRRYSYREPGKPWVFWHRYWSRKSGCFVEGPFGDRKKVMKRLCEKAGVKYFRFHPLRHSGASIMDENNVPIGAIQRILGHENRKTTEIYLHSMGNMERDAMSAFERARENSHTDSHTEPGT